MLGEKENGERRGTSEVTWCAPSLVYAEKHISSMAIILTLATPPISPSLILILLPLSFSPVAMGVRGLTTSACPICGFVDKSSICGKPVFIAILNSSPIIKNTNAHQPLSLTNPLPETSPTRTPRDPPSPHASESQGKECESIRKSISLVADTACPTFDPRSFAWQQNYSLYTAEEPRLKAQRARILAFVGVLDSSFAITEPKLVIRSVNISLTSRRELHLLLLPPLHICGKVRLDPPSAFTVIPAVTECNLQRLAAAQAPFSSPTSHTFPAIFIQPSSWPCWGFF
ncbi:hypothetical protein JTE90_009337 [Oedothorax gibbosus]|uniref:Uncharacterized protein n=1 Tax=Oedothorax gibbosus TaxID=931172 RepID=A0AAV6VS59_9ARAC|nr:hypothetical protein JTE90_009337 [Oedothorax gibbosus]